MKAKIILYGWVLSLPCMIAGLGTMEWAMETGEPGVLLGLLLFLVFVVFSILVSRNSAAVDKEMEKFEEFFNSFGKKEPRNEK